MEIGDSSENNQNRKKGLFYIFAILLTVFFLLSIFLLVKHFEKNKRLDEVFYKEKNKSAYETSVIENKPYPVQDLFLYDISNGINDKYTKSDAYFIIDRYFNNGGDIYEIYDYVNSHKELNFLKEAEIIYPEVFLKIKEKVVPATFTNDGLYATLAYFEVLDRYGYADMATRSTLSHQYLKLIYFEKEKLKLGSNTYSSSTVEKNQEKAVYFITKINNSLSLFMSNNGIQAKDLVDPVKFFVSNDKIFIENITPPDLLTGLIQYGASLRYFEAMGFSPSGNFKADDLFTLVTEFSKSSFPEYLMGISILDASTLNMLNATSAENIAASLKPIITTGLVFETKQSVIKKILEARTEKLKYFPGTLVKNQNLDQYGKLNIVSLAKKVPEFKSWLLLNGWLESDF